MTGGKQISQCCMSVIHNAMLICDHWRAKGAITLSGGQSIDSQKANTAWKEAGKQCSLHPTRKLQGTEEALSVLCPLCQYSVPLSVNIQCHPLLLVNFQHALPHMLRTGSSQNHKFL